MLKRSVAVWCLALLIFPLGISWAADAVMVGDVDAASRLVAEGGEIYMLADTPMVRELLADYVGETVEVSGSVVYDKKANLKIITVTRYRVLVPDGLEEE